jgi:cysteine synthase A
VQAADWNHDFQGERSSMVEKAVTGEVSLASIGNTPLIEVGGIFVKMECANPGGSVKDRIASFMLMEALRRGDLHRGDTVVETTSGNTGISLALVARQLDLRVLIFMPEHMSKERQTIIEHLGAEVRLTPKAEGFEGAVEKRDAYRGKPGFYIPDQFGNQDNILCHERTTGVEIVAQLREQNAPEIDCFVAGIGTGGTLMGVGAAMRRVMPAMRLVAVEPEESSVMSGCQPGEHGIMGIGDGFIPDLVDMSAIDYVSRVSTADAHAAADKIREDHGHCVGLSSGANMVAARRQAERGHAVVTLWPDCANRYVSVGLKPPASEEVNCPLRNDCETRSRELLGLADET